MIPLMTCALVHPFRMAHRARLMLCREALALRLVSVGQLIERTTEGRESDRLVAAYRDRWHADELDDLHRLRAELTTEQRQVRQELSQ